LEGIEIKKKANELLLFVNFNWNYCFYNHFNFIFIPRYQTGNHGWLDEYMRQWLTALLAITSSVH
jgi:hypothetical protein